MRLTLLAGIVAGLSGLAAAAPAEPYVDYQIQKGVWHVTTVKVDPNRLDDYVTSLKKTWGAGEEIAKRHGLIDSYQIMAKLNPEDGQGNVLLIEHIPSLALLEPDQARAQEVLKELRATLTASERGQLLENFDKVRTFVADDYWKELTFAK
jgi:hypothetical protein